MMTFIKMLSKKQLITGAVGAVVVLGSIVAAMLQGRTQLAIDTDTINNTMSIRRIAPKLNVTGKALAKELKLPLNVEKGKPLDKLNISQKHLSEVVRHLAGHTDSNPKYIVYIALVAWGWLVLVYIGRPENSTIKERKYWYPKLLYIVPLIISVAAAGFYFGKSPNPMEGIIKVFKTMVGLYPDPWVKAGALVLFSLMVIIGNKIICGWACPFGALQELIYRMPIMNKIKKIQVPFYITNTIRAVLFAVVLVILFGWAGGKKGVVVYHLINPFNLFNRDIESMTILITIVVSLAAALFTYRPYCKLVCPFGFYSWLLEKFSWYGVVINKDRCTKCMACVKACPTLATKGKIEPALMAADCFSCMECLDVCPVDALQYRKKQH